MRHKKGARCHMTFNVKDQEITPATDQVTGVVVNAVKDTNALLVVVR